MASNTSDKPVIILTGCSGLIGTRIIAAMQSDCRIVGLDVVEPEESPQSWTWMKCDLTDDESVEKTLNEIRAQFGDRIASVIHLAAYYDFSGEPSDMYEKLTVQGTRRLIVNLLSFGKVEQFIFASSLLAMKPVEDTEEKLTERSPTRGEWDYPQSKLEAERILKENHGEIPVVIHRVGGVYNEQGNSLPITQHIRRIYEKQLESYLFPGDPSHGQAFVHLDDLVDCFRKTVEKRHELNTWELFLIAEPDVMSHEELQDVIGELVHGKEWPTIRIPKAAAKAGAWVKEKIGGEDAFIKPWMIDLADDHYPVEIERARKRLAWDPVHRLRTTLPAMIEELKRDPQRWYSINNLTMPRKLREREPAGRA
jgi:nucleoside-diphosphate-sugar epimerase